ncbi:hypothetical protein HJ588_18805 [Flexivirga sp. ID2601S]|uniref:Uncharacterized protein n=3 Tax=Flexivirga TaxID=1096776 RepID=A0A849AXD4_9MICO|nr:hypothetical protein [Flexivirga aerilata]
MAEAEAAGLGDEWIGSANRLVDAAARQDSEAASEVVSEIAQRSNAFVVGVVGFIVAGQRMLLEANAVHQGRTVHDLLEQVREQLATMPDDDSR